MLPLAPAHTPDGRKVLWCPCCEHSLHIVPLDFMGRPPIVPDARGKQVRWDDSICDYDTVVLTKLR